MYQYSKLHKYEYQLKLTQRAANKMYQNLKRNEEKFNHTQEPEKNILQCCPNSEFPILDGFYVCSICGLVKEQVLDNEYQPNGCVGELLGESNGYVYKPLRFYKPLNHFREHLKSFLASHPIAFPPALLKSLQHINVHQKTAFFLIRKELKAQRKVKYYKHVWSLIHELGGKKNELTNQQYHNCLNIFKSFLVAFQANPGERKNLPSHNMILNAILKMLKIEIYYETPGLCNNKLRKNVEDTIRRCLALAGPIYVSG
jgi:hypothetical protein